MNYSSFLRTCTFSGVSRVGSGKVGAVEHRLGDAVAGVTSGSLGAPRLSSREGNGVVV